jgi:hypothetical protein
VQRREINLRRLTIDDLSHNLAPTGAVLPEKDRVIGSATVCEKTISRNHEECECNKVKSADTHVRTCVCELCVRKRSKESVVTETSRGKITRRGEGVDFPGRVAQLGSDSERESTHTPTHRVTLTLSLCLANQSSATALEGDF